VFLTRKQNTSSAKRTVADDWIASLPRDKSKLFDCVVHEWESYYAMMSIALDDAISQRAAGKLVSARQQVAVASDLLARLAAGLIHACEIASRRGRHMASLPAVNPLNGEFFRGDAGRSAASRNVILHQVIFGNRQRFFQKVKALSELIQRLGEDFVLASADIAEGITTRPVESWRELESLHHDFTTCLRESEVLLKGFLRALPGDHLAVFQAQIAESPVPFRPKARPHTRTKLRRASA
jgi:hypothetical protein